MKLHGAQKSKICWNYMEKRVTYGRCAHKGVIRVEAGCLAPRVWTPRKAATRHRATCWRGTWAERRSGPWRRLGGMCAGNRGRGQHGTWSWLEVDHHFILLHLQENHSPRLISIDNLRKWLDWIKRRRETKDKRDFRSPDKDTNNTHAVFPPR